MVRQYKQVQAQRVSRQGGPQNIEVKKIVLFLKKLLLFEIPCSIFDIQNEKHAKAIRLKGEGFKPGEWKNKGPFPEGSLFITQVKPPTCR